MSTIYITEEIITFGSNIIHTTMRKLLFLSLVLATSAVFGQAQPGFAPTPPTFIVTLQIGTDTVRKGVDTVKLTEETISGMNEANSDTNYIVTLTPIGDCGWLSFIKSNRYYFIVKEQGGATAKAAFQYMILTKQNRPWMPFRPHPPTPPIGH